MHYRTQRATVAPAAAAASCSQVLKYPRVPLRIKSRGKKTSFLWTCAARKSTRQRISKGRGLHIHTHRLQSLLQTQERRQANQLRLPVRRERPSIGSQRDWRVHIEPVLSASWGATSLAPTATGIGFTCVGKDAPLQIFHRSWDFTFCGTETHPYELYLELKSIECSRSNVPSPRIDTVVERFDRAALDAFLCSKTRAIFHETAGTPQSDLNRWLARYAAPLYPENLGEAIVRSIRYLCT